MRQAAMLSRLWCASAKEPENRLAGEAPAMLCLQTARSFQIREDTSMTATKQPLSVVSAAPEVPGISAGKGSLQCMMEQEFT